MSALAETQEARDTHARVGTRRLLRSERRWLHLLLHLIFIAASLVYALPFLWMLSTSLTLTGRELAVPPQWIPNPVVWGNYYKALTVVPMFTFFRNTSFITVTATVFGTLAASLAGFAFGRLHFPGRNLLFSLCLSTLILPGIVTVIPTFVLFREIGWINTFLPLIVPWSLGGNAFAVFLFRQYTMTIPQDLDEAARVDGAHALRIWWSVILPSARPVLATIVILSVLHHWNDFLAPLVYLQAQNLRTVALGLAMFQSDYLIEWNLMMAASTVMLIPVVVLFFVAQRYFVQGIVMTGIKG